jgi:hypothetical protein
LLLVGANKLLREHHGSGMANGGKNNDNNGKRVVLLGEKKPFWGCSCGCDDNWASRVECKKCGNRAPVRIRKLAEKNHKDELDKRNAAKLTKGGKGGSNGGSSGGGSVATSRAASDGGKETNVANWVCGVGTCGYADNFARNSACYRCGAPRITMVAGGAANDMGSVRANRAKKALDAIMSIYESEHPMAMAAKLEFDNATAEARAKRPRVEESASVQLRLAEEKLDATLQELAAATAEKDELTQALADATGAEASAAERVLQQRDEVVRIKDKLGGGVPIDAAIQWARAVDALVLVVRQLPGAVANGRQDLLMERIEEQLAHVRGGVPDEVASRVDAVAWSMPMVGSTVATGDEEETNSLDLADRDSDELTPLTQNDPAARLPRAGGPPAGARGTSTTAVGIAAASSVPVSAGGAGAQKLLEEAQRVAGEMLRKGNSDRDAVALELAASQPAGG